MDSNLAGYSGGVEFESPSEDTILAEFSLAFTSVYPYKIQDTAAGCIGGNGVSVARESR